MKYIIITIVLGVLCSQTHSQIIKISEISGDVSRIQLRSSSIVDINSNLELKINLVALDTVIGRKTNSNPELLSELQRFNSLLINQKEILELLNKNMSGFSDSAKIVALGNFSKEMQKFYGTMFKTPELRKKFNEYGLQFMKLPVSERVKFSNYYIVYGIVQLNQEISDNLKVLQKTIDQKKTRIQIVAYLNTRAEKFRKIHIENFDDYSLGEFYEVPTWVTSFTKDDAVAFAYTQSLASNLNKLVNSNFDGMGELLKNNTKSFGCIESSFNHINAVYADRENIFKKNTDGISKFLFNIQTEYLKLQNQIKQINEFDGKNVNALELFNSIQHEFISQAASFAVKIDSLVLIVPDDIKSSNQPVKDLIKEISFCKTLIKEDIDNANKFQEITEKLLRPSQVIANTGMNIGKEMFSYGLQDLPEYGYINLKRGIFMPCKIASRHGDR